MSLGDIETLIVYYDRNSDKLPHYPAVYQEGFFRFSIGLEDAEDIIADLTQAMQAARDAVSLTYIVKPLGTSKSPEGVSARSQGVDCGTV